MACEWRVGRKSEKHPGESAKKFSDSGADCPSFHEPDSMVCLLEE
jgi:hypothetical protein